MPRGKRIQPLSKPRYKYAIYSKHKSGIGSKFVRHEYTDIRPHYDTGYWFDVTNGEWALWDTDFCGFCRGVCNLPFNPEAHYISPSTNGY
jgi:hypothetical protein